MYSSLILRLFVFLDTTVLWVSDWLSLLTAASFLFSSILPSRMGSRVLETQFVLLTDHLVLVFFQRENEPCNKYGITAYQLPYISESFITFIFPIYMHSLTGRKLAYTPRQGGKVKKTIKTWELSNLSFRIMWEMNTFPTSSSFSSRVHSIVRQKIDEPKLSKVNKKMNLALTLFRFAKSHQVIVLNLEENFCYLYI